MNRIKFLFLSLTFFSWFSCSNKVDSYFGNKIDKQDIISFSKLTLTLDTFSEMEVKLAGEIITTCKKKGCWMKVRTENGEEMRVTFKDYGFFVPTQGMEGKKTVIKGSIKKKIISREDLRHFAQDEGKTQEEIDLINQPREEFSFVANGVIIED